MTGERRMFTFFKKNEYESDCITTEHSISKLLHVESLDYNLLFISQLCEIGYNCLLTDKGVTVFKRSDGSFAFKGVLRGKLYLVDFILEDVELDRCLITKTNMGCCGIEG
jgi:hypothetical protein